MRITFRKAERGTHFNPMQGCDLCIDGRREIDIRQRSRECGGGWYWYGLGSVHHNTLCAGKVFSSMDEAKANARAYAIAHQERIMGTVKGDVQ